MLPSLGFPPVELCRGTRPSEVTFGNTVEIDTRIAALRGVQPLRRSQMIPRPRPGSGLSGRASVCPWTIATLFSFGSMSRPRSSRGSANVLRTSRTFSCGFRAGRRAWSNRRTGRQTRRTSPEIVACGSAYRPTNPDQESTPFYGADSWRPDWCGRVSVASPSAPRACGSD